MSGTMFPATWTWASVTTQVSDFLSNGMVTGAVVFTIGAILTPIGVSALKRAIARK